MSGVARRLSPLYQPITLQVDFRAAHWEASKAAVIAWLCLAVGTDLAVQWGLGEVDYFRMAGSLLTFMLVMLPRRLAVAAAGLYVTQAGVSFMLWHLMQPTVSSLPVWAGYAVTYGWQLWCLCAFGFLFLTYIRTPKQAMRPPT